MKLHRKIYAADLHLADFMAKDFNFKNSKFINLQNELTLADKKEFFVEQQCKDIIEYSHRCYSGGARFLLNQKPDDLDLAKKKMRIRKYIHYTFVTFSYFLEFYIIYRLIIYFLGIFNLH